MSAPADYQPVSSVFARTGPVNGSGPEGIHKEEVTSPHPLVQSLTSLLFNISASYKNLHSSLAVNAANRTLLSDYVYSSTPNSTFGFNLSSGSPVPTLARLTQDDHWSDTSTASNVEENLGVDRSTLEVVLISIVVTLLAIVTSGGNLLVIVAFKIDKNLQTVSNYFLLSLAVADLTIGIVSMPLYTVYLLMGYWPLKAIMCDIWLSLDYTMSNASVANLIIISVDRYLSVTRPLTYRAKRTPRRAATMIGFAWVISSVMWTPWIFAWPEIEGKRSVPHNQCYIQFLTTNQYITVITAMFAFYIPVIIMSVLYFRIYRETQKRQKDLPKLQGMHKKSKKLKQHPHQSGHQASKKSMASSDEEGYSSTSDRGNNFIVHTNGMEKAASRDSQQGACRNRLLGCIKIDRDSDYMEDSSSSDQPGSPPTSHSQAHIHNTLSLLGLPRSNGSKQQLPRQDSDNSTQSLQVASPPQASAVSCTVSSVSKSPWVKPSRSVRINFSTSLIPLLPTDSPSPTGNSQNHDCPYISVDTISFSPDDHTTSPLVNLDHSDDSIVSQPKSRNSKDSTVSNQIDQKNSKTACVSPKLSNSESSIVSSIEKWADSSCPVKESLDEIPLESKCDSEVTELSAIQLGLLETPVQSGTIEVLQLANVCCAERSNRLVEGDIETGLEDYHHSMTPPPLSPPTATTTSFCNVVSETILEDPHSLSTPSLDLSCLGVGEENNDTICDDSFSNVDNFRRESSGYDDSYLGEAQAGASSENNNENECVNEKRCIDEEVDEDEEDDDDDDVEMYRVLIRLPLLSGSGEEHHQSDDPGMQQAMEMPRPSIVVEQEDDMDAFSERNPGMVQRAESDTEDEDDLSRCLRPLDRPSLPPPVRPPTGTPALARRAQSNDSVKVAQQVKIATKAATRVRKARQVASVAQAKVQSRHQERRQDQKAAKTLTAILLAFIITWTPYNIFAVVKVFCNGCVNETLYAIGEC